jgi:hypothetical protein
VSLRDGDWPRIESGQRASYVRAPQGWSAGLTGYSERELDTLEGRRTHAGLFFDEIDVFASGCAVRSASERAASPSDILWLLTTLLWFAAISCALLQSVKKRDKGRRVQKEGKPNKLLLRDRKWSRVRQPIGTEIRATRLPRARAFQSGAQHQARLIPSVGLPKDQCAALGSGLVRLASEPRAQPSTTCLSRSREPGSSSQLPAVACVHVMHLCKKPTRATCTLQHPNLRVSDKL